MISIKRLKDEVKNLKNSRVSFKNNVFIFSVDNEELKIKSFSKKLNVGEESIIYTAILQDFPLEIEITFNKIPTLLKEEEGIIVVALPKNNLTNQLIIKFTWDNEI